MLRELEGETTGLEQVADAFEPQDELAVRGILIRLQQLERDAEQVRGRRDAVASAYNQELARIDDQAEWLRRSLAAWCERNGTTKFPDVGTAYLQTGKPKIQVVDRDAFRAATGDVFVKEAWDETWAKQYALDRALHAGEIMPGVELVPGGPELRVRKS